MRTFFAAWAKAVRAARPGRLVVVLLAAVAIGLVCDWFRAEQRLVFPRPLPAFTTTAPIR
jgi:hypothetical protein